MIPGIVRAMNAPSAGPHCNRQLLKTISWIKWPTKPNTTNFLHGLWTWKFPDLQYSAIAQVRYSDCCEFCSPFLAAIDKLITLSSTIYQGEQPKIVLLPDNVQQSANSQRNFSSNRISVPSFSMVMNCGSCGQWSWLKLQSLENVGSVMFCWSVKICTCKSFHCTVRFVSEWPRTWSHSI